MQGPLILNLPAKFVVAVDSNCYVTVLLTVAGKGHRVFSVCPRKVSQVRIRSGADSAHSWPRKQIQVLLGTALLVAECRAADRMYLSNRKLETTVYLKLVMITESEGRLCCLVVRVPGYSSRGPDSISGASRFSEK
jgi:hypothetical protein